MSTIDQLAADFLSQKRIAVAGVSGKKDTPANLIFRALRSKGIIVFAVNPTSDNVRGEKCYPDLLSLPERPDGVVIVTRSAAVGDLVRQCIKAGIPRVWMHNMLGTKPKFMKGMSESMGSVSEEAVRLCRENGITVIPGACPMQFLGDFPHTCMRGILRMSGALAVSG